MPLQITWFGHAAFLIETDDVRILADPYRTPEVGSYRSIDVAADVVIASHSNPIYHSHWGAARGHPAHLNGLDFADDPQGVQAHGIQFRAVRVFESPARDIPVSMPYFSLDGISVCHSGNLGHRPTEAEIAPILDCDIFLAVAGGPPTISIQDLKSAIDRIKPKIVIPMHYQTGKVNLNLRPVDDLESQFLPERVRRESSSPLTIRREDLPSETTLVILPSAR
jgi:L-ascorbate metabolism protein UlaG (beta-lactamase superfamily)